MKTKHVTMCVVGVFVSSHYRGGSFSLFDLVGREFELTNLEDTLCTSPVRVPCTPRDGNDAVRPETP